MGKVPSVRDCPIPSEVPRMDTPFKCSGPSLRLPLHVERKVRLSIWAVATSKNCEPNARESPVNSIQCHWPSLPKLMSGSAMFLLGAVCRRSSVGLASHVPLSSTAISPMYRSCPPRVWDVASPVHASNSKKGSTRNIQRTWPAPISITRSNSNEWSVGLWDHEHVWKRLQDVHERTSSIPAPRDPRLLQSRDA